MIQRAHDMSDVIGVEGAGDAGTRLEWTAVLAFQPRPLVLAGDADARIDSAAVLAFRPRPLVLANLAAVAVLALLPHTPTLANRGAAAVLERRPQPLMLADRLAAAPASKLQCPSCGESKIHSKSIGQKGIAVVISADRYFAAHLESAGVKHEIYGGSFKVCAVCCKLGLAAFAKATALFPSCITFADAVSSSKAARVWPYRIICGGTSMVLTCVALHISYN